MVDYNCSYAGEPLHNLASAEQRHEAAKKLKGYEDELRALWATAPAEAGAARGTPGSLRRQCRGGRVDRDAARVGRAAGGEVLQRGD